MGDVQQSPGVQSKMLLNGHWCFSPQPTLLEGNYVIYDYWGKKRFCGSVFVYITCDI